MQKRKPPARANTPEVCPVCGEDVPRNALACPECGADERSGWRDEAAFDGSVPTDDFDYDEFVRDEFGTRFKPKNLPVFWWVVAIVVLVALGYLFVLRGGF